MNPVDYQIGLSGLEAEQAMANTAGNNIANAATPGYTTETVQLASETGTPVPLASGTTGPGSFGGGVQVAGIVRQAGVTVTAQANYDLAQQNGAQAVASGLSNVQGLLQEPSGNGLSAQLSTFYNDWNILAQNPQNPGSQAAVVGAGQTVAHTLNTLATNVQQQQANTAQDLSTTVQADNQTLASVAILNSKIETSQLEGLNPNALMDQRATMLQQLAGDIGARTTEVPIPGLTGPNGIQLSGIQVALPDGTVLVNGSTAGTVAVTAGTPPSLSVTYGGATSTPSMGVGAGKVGGLLNLLSTTLSGDGVGSSPTSLLNQLDGVASKLATEVNTLQVSGYYNSAGTMTTPAPVMFQASGGGSVSAASLQVNPALVATPSLVATAQSTNLNDGSNAQAISNLQNAPGGSVSLYQGVVTALGQASQQATQEQDTAQAIYAQAQQAKQSVTGVDVNQEVTSLAVDAQNYQAMTVFMQTLQQMMQSLLQAA